jgi:hypothetical protein
LPLGLARALEAALLDKTHHLMQFAAIEECAVAAADIDDRAGHPPEVDPVHQLAAARAWAIGDLNDRRSDLDSYLNR